MVTTRFEDWLISHVDGSDYIDVYNCYLAIQDKQGNGHYEVKENFDQGKLFVTPHGKDDTLMIASEKARQTILNMIEKKYCMGMDIEGFYLYNHAMEKDDR